MITILIVEDSLVMQQHLIHAISSDPMLEIVGVACDGEHALEAVKKLRPDVIAMDWQMPKLDGQQATRIIMETTPTPVVIVTESVAASDVAFTFSMIEAGALAVVKKPPGINHTDYQKDTRHLTQTLKLMSEVKLVKRLSRTSREYGTGSPPPRKIASGDSKIQLIAMGASTGGPLVIQKILSGLPRSLAVPLLIVQHIAQGFVEGFVEWLQTTSAIPLHLASHGTTPQPGHGYIAPDNVHMGIAHGPKLVLSNHGLENGLRPSVAYLFHSVADVLGPMAVGVLLTGMGRDGADELRRMKDKGAVTIAQDKESSIIHGMPGEAIKINAATYILSVEEIIAALTVLTQKK